MKILHTSDWHLGCSLGSEKRFEEFDKVLAFLVELIERKKIEAVIISGDIFDSLLPPNRAAGQYYKFLLDASRAGAKEIFVVAGNHDSPSYLEASSELLKQFRIHVVASSPECVSDLIFPVKDSAEQLIAVIAAVPYLHERDVRHVISGESALDREHALRSAVIDYYKNVISILKHDYPEVPHIVTGHLYTDVKQISKDNWTGTLFCIDPKEFTDSIDYLALGHLHEAHFVGSSKIRYAGSILPLSFKELDVAKSVTIIDTEKLSEPEIIEIPRFQEMYVIRGDMNEIKNVLNSFIDKKKSVWTRIENEGEYVPNLQNQLNEYIRNSLVRIISSSNNKANPEVLSRLPQSQKLEELSPYDVFCKFLENKELDDKTKESLLSAFKEIAESAGMEN